jgi:hypothetical protein
MKQKTTLLIIRLGQNLLLMSVSVFICVTIIELTYRCQLFDFYRSEFNYLNKKALQKNSPKKVLVFGDSFTAAAGSYVNVLNDSLSNITFINAAIPGIGVQEMNCMANKRIQEINPSLVILQVYVGNDLIDIEKPINWNTISFGRNTYWLFANQIYSLRFLNYKLGQIKQASGQALETEFLKNNDSFSIDKMSKREKLLVQADPNYYEKSIKIKPDFENRFAVFITQINQIATLCLSKNIPIKILVIPASCQVSEYYKMNLEACGAVFKERNTFDANYPFITQLKQQIKPSSIEVVNPLPYLQQSDSAGNRLYFENDLHLNNKGNIELAKFISLHL